MSEFNTYQTIKQASGKQEKLSREILPSITENYKKYGLQFQDIDFDINSQKFVSTCLDKVKKILNIETLFIKPIIDRPEVKSSKNNNKQIKDIKKEQKEQQEAQQIFEQRKKENEQNLLQESIKQLQTKPEAIEEEPPKQEECQILKGHLDIVLCACILSPNKIISGGGDGKLKIWDIQRQFNLYTIFAHQGDVWAIIGLSTKQKEIETVASGGSDGLIKVWNLATLQCVQQMRGHQIAVKCLAYVEELEYIISGGFDNRIRIWNLGDFSMVKQIHAHTRQIKVLIYAKQKSIFYSGAADGIIKIWNLLQGSLIDSIQAHTDEITSLAFVDLNQKDVHLASASLDLWIKVWNLETNQLLVQMLSVSPVNSLVYEGNCQYLFSGCEDGTIGTYQLMEGKLIKEKKVHEEKVYILIKCSEKYLISGSWDRLIKVFKFGLV